LGFTTSLKFVFGQKSDALKTHKESAPRASPLWRHHGLTPSNSKDLACSGVGWVG
jgi:hypothetical protein